MALCDPLKNLVLVLSSIHVLQPLVLTPIWSNTPAQLPPPHRLLFPLDHAPVAEMHKGLLQVSNPDFYLSKNARKQQPRGLLQRSLEPGETRGLLINKATNPGRQLFVMGKGGFCMGISRGLPGSKFWREPCCAKDAGLGLRDGQDEGAWGPSETGAPLVLQVRAGRSQATPRAAQTRSVDPLR